jgi:hypothetical protein
MYLPRRFSVCTAAIMTLWLCHSTRECSGDTARYSIVYLRAEAHQGLHTAARAALLIASGQCR